MKHLLAVLALAFVTACASTPQTPSQAVYAAHGTYAVALDIAVRYKRLPPCGGTIPLCSDKAVVARLQTADDAAYAALSTAQAAVRSGSLSEGLINAAKTAVGNFASFTKLLRTE